VASPAATQVIQSSDRLLLTGQTGSGKSFMARHLARNIPRLICLDPKGTMPEDGWDTLEDWSEKGARKLAAGKAVRLRVPPHGPEIDAAEVSRYWEPFFLAAYYARDCTVYIDEMYGVSPPGRAPTPSLTSLYTRGRGLGIGIWAATQRPVWLPLFALSESTWFFCFRLLLEQDRVRMSQMMGPNVLEPVPDEYGYHLFRVGWRESIYSRGLTA
jgi:hypothetical protein